MKFKDYYRIMGVEPSATAEIIKIAYRKLARKYHPDVNKERDALTRFTELGEANEVLKDAKKRAAFDQMRAQGWQDGQEIDVPQAREGRRHADGGDPGEAASFDDFTDFFRAHFGGGRHGGPGRGTYHERGDDLSFALPVSLEEAYRGGEHQFSFQMPSADGLDGGEDDRRTISVKIPKGVLPGARLRLRGQGRPGTRADLNGDLYLEVGLAKHPLYQVDGRDLFLEVPIAPWEAVLGARVAVPTLGGTVTATIPAGAQNAQKLRLKGRGLPGEPPGDQYLALSITVPTTTDEPTKELYRTLAKDSSFHPRATTGAWA
jgi:curved DNA-binding protein